MAPRKTSFNFEWKKIYPWINRVPNDDFKAYCKLCNKIFCIGGKGEGSVKEHADGSKHKDKEKAKASTPTVFNYFASTF